MTVFGVVVAVLITRGSTRPVVAASPTITRPSAGTTTTTDRPEATVVAGTAVTSTTRPVTTTSQGVPTGATDPGRWAAAVAGFRLVNYYPSDDAWTYMWTRWDPTTIGQDFATIAAMGANTVRLNVFPSTFGFPTPSGAMMRELESAVDLAAAHGLRVQLALFDWWNSYEDISDSTLWARAVLAPFASSPEVAFIDLRNEIDVTNPAAMAWARVELPVVERLAGTVPVTLSVPSAPPILRSLVDALGSSQPEFYDVHYYGPLGGAYAVLAADRIIAGSRPLYVGETGYSTAGHGLLAASAETNQALYLNSAEWAAAQLHLAPAAPWILEDLVPSGFPTAAVFQPYKTGYGLLRSDGSPKEAADVIRGDFQSGTVSPVLDPQFLTGTAAQPAGWLPVNPAQGQLSWVAGVSAGDGGSVELAATGADRSAVPAFATTLAPAPLHPGQLFTAWAWAKGTAVTGANEVDIAWFGPDGDYLSLRRSPVLPAGTTDWTRLTVTAPAPTGASYAQVRLSSSGNSGAVWFSDVGVGIAG